MIVLDAAGDPETSRRAEIAALEDNALREDDTGMRFGARDRIPDRAAFDLDVLAAPHACLDAIEGEVVRNGVGPVHLRPRPAEDLPRPPDLSSEERFNRPALRGIRALIDQDQRLAVALMDRAGPIDVDGEVQSIQLDPVIGAVLDVPRPASFALSGGRPR